MNASTKWVDRQLARMDASAEQRAINPYDDPNYGHPGAGSWGQGMTWVPAYSSMAAVSTANATRLSAVYACLRILSENIATLPLDTYTRLSGSRESFPRPGYLTFEIPQGSRITYLSEVMLSLLTDGNAFVATPRDDLGTPVDLVPLDPTKIEVGRVKGRKRFKFGDQEYDEFDIMHIPGMTMPGEVRGMSPLRAARDAVDGGLKAQEYGRTFMGNLGVPPAVIELPAATGKPDPTRARRVATAWAETHGGPNNAGKVGVLTDGASLKSIAISPEDAQWLDSKRFAVQDIARFYGIPPHLLADSSNSTSWGSGLQEQNLAFGQLSLRPWIERIEDAHTRLLSTHGLRDVFIKLNLDALLRASLSDRYAAHAIGIAGRFKTRNEVRRDEDLPPLPGGDGFDESTDPTARDISEMIQKIYLGVGVVITEDEAREILNRGGAGLAGPFPTGGAA